MRSLRAALMLGLAACGGADGGVTEPPCTVDISFTPATPIAGPTTEVRAAGFVDNDIYGVRTYTWTVRRDGASVMFEDARLDGSEITFIADEPGVYQVTSDVDVPGYQCSAKTASVTARSSDEGGPRAAAHHSAARRRGAGERSDHRGPRQHRLRSWQCRPRSRHDARRDGAGQRQWRPRVSAIHAGRCA